MNPRVRETGLGASHRQSRRVSEHFRRESRSDAQQTSRAPKPPSKTASTTEGRAAAERNGARTCQPDTRFARQQPPLEMLVAGILLARLVGIHRKSWAQAIIGRIRPSCRVERTIGAGGRVARPMRRGTKFSRRGRKTVFAIFAKKLTKLPSGGLNRGPSPSYPQKMPLGWPKRPPKTAHFCSAIFLCQ